MSKGGYSVCRDVSLKGLECFFAFCKQSFVKNGKSDNFFPVVCGWLFVSRFLFLRSKSIHELDKIFLCTETYDVREFVPGIDVLCHLCLGQFVRWWYGCLEPLCLGRSLAQSHHGPVASSSTFVKPKGLSVGGINSFGYFFQIDVESVIC